MTEEEKCKKIIAEMHAVYAAMHSYADRGVVLRRLDEGEPPNETRFEMLFKRPGFFRFAWISHHPYLPLRHIEWHSVIWANDTGAFNWHMHNTESSTGKRKDESLEMAIAGATGVSGGAAYTVPTLLMPSEDYFSFAGLQRLHLADTVREDGVLCHQLMGIHEAVGTVEAWIGVEDHLLRRTRHYFRDLPSDEIHTSIRVNPDIPDALFVGPQIEGG
jgi:hypothetical protein